jgi:hypothetical protein
MKKSFFTFALLRFRNTMHALAPESCATLESFRQTLQFRCATEYRGYQEPLPAFIKRSILKRYCFDQRLETLVETGTQYGDTLWFFRNQLATIWSIELSQELAYIARRRFRRYPHIHIVEGDSSDRLSDILPQLTAPTLFWLDGHYSSGITARGALDCPIYAELEAVFALCSQRWIVMIDDARFFGKEKDYPSLSDLRKFVANKVPAARFEVADDIIRIIPQDGETSNTRYGVEFRNA